MVNVKISGFWEFKKNTEKKNIYCFAAGKRFQKIVEQYDFLIKGVLDNYCSEKTITLDMKTYPVYSVDEFIKRRTSEDVILITCVNYQDIVYQLDRIPELDGIDCYLGVYMNIKADHFETIEFNSDKSGKIPKVIHYCWFGGKALPKEYEAYIASWRTYCPDYEIVRWDETNYDIKKCQYMKQAYENKMWAFVSDYARLDVIYNYGGIYLDTDVELRKSLDDMLGWDMFCGYESCLTVAFGLGFGACKGHEIIGRMLEKYNHMSFLREDGSMDLTPCPVLQTEVMREYGFRIDGRMEIRENVAVYPQEVFAPVSYGQVTSNITEHTYSIHHYAASWVKNKCTQPPAEAFLMQRKQHYAQADRQNKENKYQIWECLSEAGTAGSKAPMDIKAIAEACGYNVIQIHRILKDGEQDETHWSQKRNEEEWHACYEEIPEGATLMLQHPFWQEQKAREYWIRKLKQEKNVKVISVVHDVEELRKTFWSEYMTQEFAFMLEVADVLIVHNEVMKQFFIEKGVKEEKLVVLQIFDYLSDKKQAAEFEASVSIAGNLDKKKSAYLEKLEQAGIPKIHMYGPNYRRKEEDDAIVYHGSFSSEEIVQQLNKGFGLVWDGDSAATCSGNMGNYLRYNNPHKLSLYLASGLPVFIWEKAAEASFVTEHAIGIPIHSLEEIADILNQMDESRYIEYKNAVEKIKKKLSVGEFTRNALEKAERICSN